MPSPLTGTAKRYAIQTRLLILVVTVVLGVGAARFGVMFFSVAGVAVRGVGVVRGLLVVAGFVVLGGFAVMLRGVLVMFGGLVMMFDGVLAHVLSRCGS